MRETGKLRDHWFDCQVLGAFLKFPSRFTLDISLPQSGARSYIVNVLLDVVRNVVLLARDIEDPRRVFPKVKVGDEEPINLGDCRIKLNPLERSS
jgi:hypothetical protein